MEVAPEVTELEALAAQAGVPIFDALARAGVAKSTYWRWRHDGKDPLSATLRKVRSAIRELSEQAA